MQLEVVFEPPPGQQLDERYGPAARLVVDATPPSLLRQGAGRDTFLTRSLLLDSHVGNGVLHVAATAASCDASGVADFPACHVHQQDWGVPVRVTPDGASEILLSGGELDGPSSGAFGVGKDRKNLYIANAAFPVFPGPTPRRPSVMRLHVGIRGEPRP